MLESLNVIALVRDQHADKFIFLYDEESIPSLYDHLEVLAADEELDFSLQNVVCVCRKIKELQAVNASGILNFE